MRVLLCPSSKHGGTVQIGRAIARVLRESGIDVDVSQPEHLHDVAHYDAFVVGSAVYLGNWTSSALEFLEQFNAELVVKPTWLFSSGLTEETTEDTPSGLRHGLVEELLRTTGAREHREFGGRLVMSELGRFERVVVRTVGASEADVRPWQEIELWATTIAAALNALDPKVSM